MRTRKKHSAAFKAKVPHRWEFVHDHIGYNYRMPNINAALSCAQLEQIDVILVNKRETAEKYKVFFKDKENQYQPTKIKINRSLFLNT